MVAHDSLVLKIFYCDTSGQMGRPLTDTLEIGFPASQLGLGQVGEWSMSDGFLLKKIDCDHIGQVGRPLIYAHKT